MSDECFEALRERVSTEVADAALKDVLEQIRKLRALANKDPHGGNFQKRMHDFLQQRRLQNLEELIVEAEEIAIFKREVGHINQSAFSDSPTIGMESILGGANRLSAKGDLSIENISAGNEAKHKNNLRLGLEQNADLEVARSGTIDRDIYIEKFQLETRGGKPGITKNPQAKRIAEVTSKTQNAQLKDAQNSGSRIKQVEGYITRRTHDAEMIFNAGKETWVEDLLSSKWLDFNRVFGIDAGDIEKQKKILGKMFDNITKPKPRSSDALLDSNINSLSKRKKLDKLASSTRALHFVSGEAEFEYNQKYGSGTFLENVEKTIRSNARQSALIQRLGPNPEKMWERLIQNTKINHPDKFSVGDEKRVRDLFKEASGFTSIPGRSMAAKIGRALRQLKAMASLGRAVLATTTDLTNAASMLSASTGENFLKAHAIMFSAFLKSMPKSERKAWAQKLHLTMNGLLGEHYDRFSGGIDTPAGLIGKMSDNFYKLTQFTAQTEIGKTAVASVFAMRMHDFAGSGFKDLDPRFKASLERYGIGDSDWNVIRTAKEEISDGQFALTPEKIGELDNVKLEAVIERSGKKISADAYKLELEQKLAAYLTDHANKGVPTPGIRQRRFLIRGHHEDEGMGQFLRYVAQFKSFPLTMGSNFMRVALSDPERAARNFGDVLKGRGDTPALVGMMASATAMGYVALMAKDFAVGKEPRDPTDPETWREAFIQGGAGGLVGDFFLGEYDKQYKSPLKDLAGPVLSQVVDIGEMIAQARDFENLPENKQKLLSRSFNLLLRNVPGQNIMFGRMALDYLFLQEIQESLNPGFTSRMERRALEKDQDFIFFRPSEALR